MREMYLMNWKTPSYHTFGYFINEVLLDSIEEIFRDINIAIFKQDHENLSHLYIDGTKLKANANKYTCVYKKSTITALLNEMNGQLCWNGLHINTKIEYVLEYLSEIFRHTPGCIS